MGGFDLLLEKGSGYGLAGAPLVPGSRSGDVPVPPNNRLQRTVCCAARR
jgi:hypothetical protein